MTRGMLIVEQGGLGYKAESSGREEDKAGQPDLHKGQIFTCMQQRCLMIHVLKDFLELRQMLRKKGVKVTKLSHLEEKRTMPASHA